MKHIKLVTDSACDPVDELVSSGRFKRVPLAILLGDREFVDDESLNVQDLLDEMKKSGAGSQDIEPLAWRLHARVRRRRLRLRCDGLLETQCFILQRNACSENGYRRQTCSVRPRV